MEMEAVINAVMRDYRKDGVMENLCGAVASADGFAAPVREANPAYTCSRCGKSDNVRTAGVGLRRSDEGGEYYRLCAKCDTMARL